MVVQNTFHHTWNVIANRDANGQYILLANKLPLIHAAVLKACDAIDGLADGLIEDPRACRFDPAVLQCAAGQHPSTCLSAAEVGVVRRLHDGATDAQGHRLEPKISHEWGSELGWTLFVPAAQGQTTFSENIALGFLRYLAYFNVANPDYQLSDLAFTVPSFWQTVQTSRYLSATDPDLGSFARKGGKLLLWHGWNDQHIAPQATLEYYDAVRRTVGAHATDHFARLFLFPGVTHCSGGEGPDTFDVLTPVMAWVEGGVAPEKIVASKVVNGSVTAARAVYPYAGRNPRHDYRWVGQPLYSHGYQTWCQAAGTQLVCDASHPLPGAGGRQDD
jgi:feruloyl esterase